MKLAILSDLHFGDPTSTLVARSGSGSYTTGPGFERLRAALSPHGPFDYLVLLGDVFDFSVTGWSDAYEASKPFLRGVQAHGLAHELLYIPGNHDFSAWVLTLQQTNVIGPIERGQPLRDRWTRPAVLDTRAAPLDQAPTGLQPKGGTPSPASGQAMVSPGYSGLFFDKLAGIRFQVVYPNLYLVEKSGKNTLITHGHYFEGYWSMTSRLASQVFGADLKLASRGAEMNVEELVAVNFPLNELASSGTGQAGPLTPVVRSIQLDAKVGKLDHIRAYLKNLQGILDKAVSFEGLGQSVKELATDTLMGWMVEKVAGMLTGNQPGSATAARYNADFFQSEQTQQNIRQYLDACLLELASLSRHAPHPLPPPSRVIFGHTHVPILSTDPTAPTLHHAKSNQTVTFWNTGGWLQPEGPAREAAVMVYDDSAPTDAHSTASPWSSIRIAH